MSAEHPARSVRPEAAAAPFRRFSLLLLLPALTFLPGTASALQTDHVVLVVIDGLRYSEGLGDPAHTWSSTMFALSQQGTRIEPFENDGYTYTARAIPAIWCGAWTGVSQFSDPDCGGQINSYAELPTVFEYFRKGLARPAEDCIYVLKALCSWKASFHPSYGPDFWPIYHTAGSTDQEVWEQAETVLATQAPSFMVLYLADVDHAGHSGDWSAYTQAITVADRIVGELWQTLQANPSYAGRTTLIVTNDHGRHYYDFSRHGDGCAGCRTIQLLAIGPNIKAGFVSGVRRTIPDIAPTIGSLLGFSTDLATGSPMGEILEIPIGAGDDRALSADRRLMLRVSPNPIVQGAELRFRLSTPGATRSMVHDVAGRLVATILSRDLDAGEQVFRWNGRGLDGGPLASGLYFLTVTAPEATATRRIVLLP